MSREPNDGSSETPRVDAWTVLASSFAALGRVVLLLDPELHVVRASPHLDTLVCRGTHERVIGKPIGALLGARLFQVGDEVHRALSVGSRIEGRRAFIKCVESGAQLVSVSVAPLGLDAALALHPRARFMVVVRAADDVFDPTPIAPTHGLMARAPSMLRIVALIEALSDSDANVLITGETGTGKGLVAAALHAQSPRRDGPFVTVDAGAIPSELLESELFGHVKGAFTGAHRDRVGQIELARGGTLFLDEIGDMPLPLQSKLLRLVEEREFRRLGESTPRSMDARIIAATHVDLPAAIALHRFREDLYYRLCVVPIELPPLRERPGEVAPLAHHLLARVGAAAGRALLLGDDAIAVLEAYAWPGNVRQLENALEHAVAVCRGQTLHAEDLPNEVRDPRRATPSRPVDPELSIATQPRHLPAPAPLRTAPAIAGPQEAPLPHVSDADEVSRIKAALEGHRWNRGAAAQALGMSRTTLWRKLRMLGLD
ncbi:MAG: sigma-54-dependent Fis family transcriptional regulator [Deltaproteobacteria bacterium]|nr:sigma-54-dependent Fis family transcriptional regulator [Deltaproteobacteria bacterium]